MVMEYFVFSDSKVQRSLELMLFVHMAIMYSDSHLCEQERLLTGNLIEELMVMGYEKKDILKTKERIEEYLLLLSRINQDNFVNIFALSLKKGLPPMERDLHDKLAHILMKGAYCNGTRTEQERGIIDKFRKVLRELVDEEQKKADYGLLLGDKKTGTDVESDEEELASSKQQETSLAGHLLPGEKKSPIYQFSFVDDMMPDTIKENHYHQYEGGVPDEVELYEEDQIRVMEMVQRIWDVQRKKGRDKLRVKNLFSLPEEFVLDGIVYGVPVTEDTEIIVVGDLHGCYNNLKAVLWQTNFKAKVNSGHDIYLVFLGDFFDRGTRTIDGIMPLVLQLILEYPDHVLVLRGNHEHLVKNRDGVVVNAVRPSDTFDFWKEHLSNRFFEQYMLFFEQMPVMAFFKSGIIAVHAGIPPADVIQKISVISDINHLDEIDTKKLLYSVLWTDPGTVEDCPINMKAVFHAPFGKKQFRHFMEKMGASLIIRGHEEVANGCEFTYPDTLITVFSAGGKDNPQSYSYTHVTPRFVRITGNTTVEAVKIHWEFFNDEPG
jgi:diadenosine tetraphosphatase ApaH/serine/threonine PP2A family protein phosphatase